ncbi:MAG: outer membrane beta-barrel protein [Chitinophagaceae bacterium]|nr:outer membrane beta-barrel protein [Chitinophagaceae bacterium]
MKKLTAFLFTCMALAFTTVSAQQASLKGTVVDSSSKINLHRAVISVLRTKDSVLVKFVRADETGAFSLKGLPAGKFLIMTSYPDYADYLDEVVLEAGKETSLKPIYMMTKAHLLEEVIVKQRVAAIRMKGDTTEYKADSFYVGPNANVQDLLKRMPGIQVNSKGEITAQGQKVEKVLVDGEEFFSDDPAVVTQNLRADAVDKVQVFDKKSDQAVFTGIDDGQTAKTINLQLKDDKKKGYFGKVEAGTDFSKYRYGKAMLNAFKAKRKIAAFVTHDNTKFESLDWNERTNYATNGDNMQVMEDGGIAIFGGGDEFSYGNGLPKSTTGGFLYNNKWGQDKHNLNSSYQYNNLNVTGRTQTTTQTILPDTTFINSQDQNFVSDRRRNRITSKYEVKPDSTSNIKFTLTGSIVNNKNANNFLGKSISEEGQLINQSNRTTTNDGEDRNLLGSLLWQKRLKKKGRTLSFNGDFSFTNKKNDGYLFAKNDFYDQSGALIRQDNLDQLKTNKEAISAVSGKFVYTEPIWKNTFLELNYRFAFSRNDAERRTLERTGPGGKYENQVDTLSNHFIYGVNNHTGGFTFRWNEKKINLYGGAALGVSDFRLDDLMKGQNRNISFNNFLPTAGFTFTPKKQRRYFIRYNGTTRNPTLAQIQPFIDNIDPLSITIGNPNLKQEFRHSFNFGYSDYKVLKSKNFYIDGSFTTTTNAITNASFVDALGRRVNQAINVNGNYSGYMWSSYGFEIIPTYNLSFRFSPNISRNVNMVNGRENVNKNKSLGLGTSFGRWSEKMLSFYFSVEARYNESSSSIRPDIVTKFWSYNGWSNLDLKLPGKIFFNAEGNFNLYQNTSAFGGNANSFRINASLKKTLGKADQWEIKGSVNDLLNQNQNISRNISSNFVSETIQQNIRRFWMLTLSYNFSKNGKPTAW